MINANQNDMTEARCKWARWTLLAELEMATCLETALKVCEGLTNLRRIERDYLLDASGEGVASTGPAPETIKGRVEGTDAVPE